ncbi:polyphosphate polymerase domain-containing protein [bacterium]|nr:polyphosphate polymerase domain-containing protein [bacterium]
MTATYRHEDKYWLTPIQAAALKGQLSHLLRVDPTALATDYLVRSVYFDSLDDQDYHDKLAGIEKRQKVRLRTYDPASKKAKLEVKYKFGQQQRKCGLWLTSTQTHDFLAARFASLRNVLLENTYLQELYPRLITKCYRPKVWCEYHRQAFVHPQENLRLTLDHDIRTSETNFDLFVSHTPLNAVTWEATILEIKYNQQLPKFLPPILAHYQLEPAAISKYCHSRLNYYEILDS